MIGSALAIFRRDVSLAYRSGGGAAQSALFFAIVVLLFAFAVGPDRETLAGLAAPILWAAALLATLVSLERLFQADAEDGSLDIIVETSEFLGLSVLAKAAAHWVTTMLPLILAAPALALILNLPAEGYGPLLLSLFAGTPALSLTGAFVAAVTVSLRRAGVLIAILSAPLYAPTLIFGVDAAQAGGGPALLFLCAGSLIAGVIAPLAGAAAIRFNMS